MIRKVISRLKEEQRILKFATTGAIFSLINLAVLFVFTEFVGLYYLISSVFAFFIGSTGSFLLNKKWTFQENIIEKETERKYLKFLSINILTSLAGAAILFILTSLFYFYYLISQALAITFCFTINYFFITKKVFKKRTLIKSKI